MKTIRVLNHIMENLCVHKHLYLDSEGARHKIMILNCLLEKKLPAELTEKQVDNLYDLFLSRKKDKVFLQLEFCRDKTIWMEENLSELFKI